jgi:cyclohexadienyl dehydratase
LDERDFTIHIMRNALRGKCLFTLLATCLIAAMTGCTALRPGLCKTPERPAIKRIQDLGLLRVGSIGDYRPLTWLDSETGRWEGFDIDVAERIAAELGVRIEFV